MAQLEALDAAMEQEREALGHVQNALLQLGPVQPPLRSR
jgi:hypothetical protein